MTDGRDVNLLADVFERFSSGPMRAPAEASRAMPRHLFRRALRMNPLLTADDSRVARIVDAVDFRTSARRQWRDPEIYQPIFTLADTGTDPVRTDTLLTRLEIQLGLRPVSDAVRLPDGAYRLPDGMICRVEGGRLSPFADGVIAAVDSWPGTVYLPRLELFADLVPAQYTPGASDPSADPSVLAKLSTACQLLRRTAPTVADDVADALSVIVLLPDEDAAVKPCDPMRLRWSFNLRLSYVGAIFLNLFPVEVYGALEGIVHEYYHQRLWQWWELERPSGIPDPQVMIISPVTGLSRAAAVMTQALLIYVGIYRVFQAVAADATPPGASKAWLDARLEHLTRHVPTLHDSLRRIMPSDTTIAKALDLAMASFSAAA